MSLAAAVPFNRALQHRGLLYNEERGTIEKFRPWGLPSEAYLVAAGRALAGRSS